MANTLIGRLTPTNNMGGTLTNESRLTGQLGGVGAVVTYASLPDKPSINNVELVGNKTTSDLNISYNDLRDQPVIPDVGEIDERLDDLEGDITSLSGRVTTAEGNITSLGGRLTTAEGNITTLQGDTGALDTRLTTAEGDITSLSGRVTTAEGDITSLGGRLTTAEGNITTLQGDTGALDTRLTTAEGDITSLSGRVTTAEGNITSLGGRLTTAEGNITSLDGRVTTNEGDISDLQGDMSQAQSDITQLNSSKANKQWTRVLQVDITSNTDQTVQVTYPDEYSELLFTIQRLDNGRTIGTNIMPKDQFNGGACYVGGSYTIVSLAMNQNANEYVNGVFLYTSSNSIEVAFNKGSVNLRARAFAR